MSLLQVSNIAAYYGASQALFDVSLSLAEGECLAMMGRNGMGKSTTIKTICKLLKPSDGRIVFAGVDTANLPAYKVARLGVGLVPEGRRCFGPLTVEENLIATARKDRHDKHDNRGSYDLAAVFALFPRLAERSTQVASTLSGGEQQMLVIGRALMTNPRLLILDEATEGLAPVVRQEIWAAIAMLKAESGLAILVVDKSLRELAQVADNAVIIERGRDVWSGAMSDLGDDIQQQYLGV